jgi:hypothetical protein
LPITQVSVFLDNRPGSLYAAMSKLDQTKIKIFAISIADAGEFGLVRIITSDPAKARASLEETGFILAKAKKNTEVTAIFIPENAPLSKITKLLSDVDINIDYAYSSAIHVAGKIALILRPSDIQKAERIFIENDIVVLTLEQISQYFKD